MKSKEEEYQHVWTSAEHDAYKFYTCRSSWSTFCLFLCLRGIYIHSFKDNLGDSWLYFSQMQAD
jgi:fumarate reductase subunit C